MFRKYFVPFIILSFFIIFIAGCSSSEVAIQDPVVGIIKTAGNENEKMITININDKDIYYLEGSSALMKELAANSGKVYEIKYSGAKETEGKIILSVEKAIPLGVELEKKGEKFAPGTAGVKCELVEVKQSGSEYNCNIKIINVIGYGSAVPPIGEGRILKLNISAGALGNAKIEKGNILNLQIAAPQQGMGMQENDNWQLIKIIK